MDIHQRQQFDFLLQTAVERYVERLEQRNQGPLLALSRLRESRNGETIRLNQFVDAVFDDFLLSNPDGAAFVLRALAARPMPAAATFAVPSRIETVLVSLSKAVFAELLAQKTEEVLEQHAAYQTVDMGGR